MLTSISVEEILLPSDVNLFNNSRGLLLKEERAFSCLKNIYSVLFGFT